MLHDRIDKTLAVPEISLNIRLQGVPNLIYILIGFKMAVKCLPHIESRLSYHHKDPPFDITLSDDK